MVQQTVNERNPLVLVPKLLLSRKPLPAAGLAVPGELCLARTMAHETIERMRSTPGLSLVWLGNLGWLIHADGTLIATDLDLHLDLRLRPSPVPVEAIAPQLAALLVTHEHGDHFNPQTVRYLAERSSCRFVLPASCRAKAREIGIPDDRVDLARPGSTLDVAGVAVTPTHALHGHLHGSVYRGASLDDCGYDIAIGGLRLFQPGDTVLLHEHLEMGAVDLLFVSPTEHNTGIAQSVELIRATAARTIVAQHFGTYREESDNSFWTHGYPDELRAALDEGERERFRVPQMGELMRVPG
jgi:L-ascorbate 6-phosphate lactonase